MVRFSFRHGIVRYNPSEKQYILAFRRFPLIYVFDENLELSDTYQITDFIQGSVVYNRVLNGARYPNQSRSMIYDVQIIEDQFALIKLFTNFKEENSEGSDSVRQDYYVIDFASRQSYHLGAESGSDRLLYITGEGIILHQFGTLYLIPRET